MPEPVLSADLESVTLEIERVRWAAVLCDVDWRLCWVSTEQKKLLHEDHDRQLGVGEHLLRALQREAWARAATPESMIPELRRALPVLLRDVDADERERLWPGSSEILSSATPLSPVLSGVFSYLAPNLPPTPIAYLGVGVAARDGRLIGNLLLFSSGLRASVQDLLVRGDEATLERMATLLQPRRESAAVVFADLQSSTVLSRELSNAGYFRLLRDVLRVIDDVVVGRAGLVSKHPGDGVVAFFRVVDAGSPSRAVRGALEAVRSLRTAVRDVAAALAAELPITPADCLVNIGMHFAQGIYLGQIVTSGRLEVTGLGEDVSVTARLQQSVVDGGVLASKPLLERLDAADAVELGLELDRLRYSALAGLPDVPDKARRDAGELSVTDLRGWADTSSS